jgi:hypothetical protein
MKQFEKNKSFSSFFFSYLRPLVWKDLCTALTRVKSTAKVMEMFQKTKNDDLKLEIEDDVGLFDTKTEDKYQSSEPHVFSQPTGNSQKSISNQS